MRNDRDAPGRPPPSTTARLFHDPAEARTAGRDPVSIGRLLEQGERDELRWLVAELGEEPLAAWLAERGGRQLTRRSRAFWRLVLATEPSAPVASAEELWPL